MNDDRSRDGAGESKTESAEMRDLFGSIPPAQTAAPYREQPETTFPSVPAFAPPLRDRDGGSFGAGFVIGLFCGVLGLVYALTSARPQTRNGVFFGLCVQVTLGVLGALTQRAR